MSTLTLDALEKMIADMPALDQSIMMNPKDFRRAMPRPDPPTGLTTFSVHYGTAINTYGGIPLVVDPHVPEGKACILNPGEAVVPSNSVLISKSEMTITEDMSEQTNMIDTAELLVELDRKVAQHGGRFGTHIEATGHLSGTLFTGDSLALSGRGKVGFVFHPVSEGDDGEFDALVSPPIKVNVDELQELFPAIAAELQGLVSRACDRSLSEFVWETEDRLNNKPALIALVHDYLKNGRDVIAGLKADQVEQEQAGFYGRKDDYGTF